MRDLDIRTVIVFFRVLKYSKAKPAVLAEARRFTCSVCELHQQVKTTRRSAPPRELRWSGCHLPPTPWWESQDQTDIEHH